MKYIIVLGDGMSDEPLDQLNGKTPLEVAKTPELDRIARKSELGLAHTIPEGMSPGSDTANLSVLGYDPKIYYTGRSPLEALSIGVDLKDTDIAIRCNLVTLEGDDKDYDDKTMLDHSSGEISTEEAEVLLNAVKKELENKIYKFYLGTSYRHLLVWDKGKVLNFSQPHDILTKKIKEYLPKDKAMAAMMRKSFEILDKHPINVEREKRGLNKANSIWFWGAGTKPHLDNFQEKNNKKGAMISAVDLLKGIAIGSNMKNIHVEGANGTLHTNYEGKAKSAVDVLLKDNYDFVYIHVEAPDEMGHQGNIENKIKAIEFLDQRIIKPVIDEMVQNNIDFRMLVMPDHPTPIWCRTHTMDPVPYLIYDTSNLKNESWAYNEKEAKASGNVVEEGHTMLKKLFKK